MPSCDAKHWPDPPTEPPFSLDVPAHRDTPAMSRSVDPADRNRAVTPIPSNDCSDKSSGRSVPPIGSFLGRQQDFPSGVDDRGLKGSDCTAESDLLRKWSALRAGAAKTLARPGRALHAALRLGRRKRAPVRFSAILFARRRYQRSWPSNICVVCVKPGLA